MNSSVKDKLLESIKSQKVKLEKKNIQDKLQKKIATVMSDSKKKVQAKKEQEIDHEKDKLISELHEEILNMTEKYAQQTDNVEMFKLKIPEMKNNIDDVNKQKYERENELKKLTGDQDEKILGLQETLDKMKGKVKESEQNHQELQDFLLEHKGMAVKVSESILKAEASVTNVKTENRVIQNEVRKL